MLLVFLPPAWWPRPFAWRISCTCESSRSQAMWHSLRTAPRSGWSPSGYSTWCCFQ